MSISPVLERQGAQHLVRPRRVLDQEDRHGPAAAGDRHRIVSTRPNAPPNPSRAARDVVEGSAELERERGRGERVVDVVEPGEGEAQTRSPAGVDELEARRRHPLEPDAARPHTCGRGPLPAAVRAVVAAEVAEVDRVVDVGVPAVAAVLGVGGVLERGAAPASRRRGRSRRRSPRARGRGRRSADRRRSARGGRRPRRRRRARPSGRRASRARRSGRAGRGTGWTGGRCAGCRASATRGSQASSTSNSPSCPGSRPASSSAVATPQPMFEPGPVVHDRPRRRARGSPRPSPRRWSSRSWRTRPPLPSSSSLAIARAPPDAPAAAGGPAGWCPRCGRPGGRARAARGRAHARTGAHHAGTTTRSTCARRASSPARSRSGRRRRRSRTRGRQRPRSGPRARSCTFGSSRCSPLKTFGSTEVRKRSLRGLAEDDHVEQPVVELGLRSDVHPAAVGLRVRHRHRVPARVVALRRRRSR